MPKMASVVFKKSEDDCPKSHQLLSVLLSYSADFEKNTLKCAGIIHFGMLRIAFNNRDDLGLKQRKVGINTDFRAIGPAADTQFFDQTSKHVVRDARLSPLESDLEERKMAESYRLANLSILNVRNNLRLMNSWPAPPLGTLGRHSSWASTLR